MHLLARATRTSIASLLAHAAGHLGDHRVSENLSSGDGLRGEGRVEGSSLDSSAGGSVHSVGGARPLSVQSHVRINGLMTRTEASALRAATLKLPLDLPSDQVRSWKLKVKRASKQSESEESE